MRPRAPIPSACCSPRARRKSCCAPRSRSATAATASPVLVGRDDVHDRLRALGVDDPASFEVHQQPQLAARAGDGRLPLRAAAAARLSAARGASGWSTRTATSSASLLLALGEADAMITGVTRTYAQTMREVRRVLDPQAGRDAVRHPRAGRPEPHRVHRRHDGQRAADRASSSPRSRSRPPRSRAAWATSRASPSCPIRPSAIPRAAGSSTSATRCSCSTSATTSTSNMKARWRPTWRSIPTLQKLYPFSRLSGPANVLVMPGLQPANISAKLLRELGGDAVIGPMLVGMEKPVQIARDDRERVRPGDAGRARAQEGSCAERPAPDRVR